MMYFCGLTRTNQSWIAEAGTNKYQNVCISGIYLAFITTCGEVAVVQQRDPTS